MKIQVSQMYDTILIEKYKGNTILKGSRLFCGCCGGEMGTMKQELTFPFQHTELIKALKNCSFTASGLGGGCRHKCGHTMFTFKTQWGFTPLDQYLIDEPEAEIIIEA